MNKSLFDLKEGDKVFCGKINFNTLEFNIGETIVVKTVDYVTLGHRIIYTEDIPKNSYPVAYMLYFHEQMPISLTIAYHVISISKEEVRKVLLGFVDENICCYEADHKELLDKIRGIQKEIAEIRRRNNALVGLKLMINKH